jgi:iron(III) transport system ATP-binding protein
MTFVSCEGLSKAYGAVQAVSDFTLTIRAGEILALLGPSGCGKTTVLRSIAGFERPDAGRITIGEREVAGPGGFVPPEGRRIGMVFQHYALFPHLSVADNVAFGLRGAGRAERVAELLELVGLAGLGGRMPHALSGGQQQRVALARALAPRPAVLLLDEPFSNLDADLRSAMRAQVRAILKQVGTTAIFVTHDQDEALFMGDRVGVMRAGRLEQVAEPPGLYLAPASRFVAQFIGTAAFLPATVVEAGVTTSIGLLPQRVTAPGGTALELVVRPDDLELAADPQGNGRIVARTFRGEQYLYEIELDKGQRLHCICNHIQDFAPGTRVRVRLDPGHALAWFPVAG